MEEFDHEVAVRVFGRVGVGEVETGGGDVEVEWRRHCLFGAGGAF